jgi:putative colanic acid biosynthesis UDP-glucose lipid carrier transferase
MDAASILTGLAIAAYHTLGRTSESAMLIGVAAIVLFYLAAEVTGMYRSWRGVSTERELFCTLATWGSALLVLLSLGHFTPYAGTLPPLALAIWLVITPLAIATGRILIRGGLRALRARGFNSRGFAIVGVNDLGIQLARNIEGSPELGLKLAGFYEDRAADRLPEIPADIGHQLGDIDQLVAEARAGRVSMIYITFPMRAEDRIREVLGRLADSTASVYVVPDFFVFELLHSRWTNIQGLPVVSVFENPLYGIDGAAKRALDLVGGGLALAALALPMAVIALFIKLTSRGPVFFRQKRYGLDGREILVWKFRSMTVCENSTVVTQATKNDARVTPLGRILRKTSLDELPQLFNVLEGSMSLVGPRPHATAHNETYRKMIDGYMLRHKVKPGITGLAQVRGWRGETDTLEKMERRIECDHQYIREWSLWMDIKILLKTVLVVFNQKNAF